TGASAIETLAETISSLHQVADPTEIVRFGIAADYVDQLGGCREALWRVVDDGRAGGAVGSAINALFLLAVDDWHTGQWLEADAVLDEGLQLCAAGGYRILAWPGHYIRALLAAARGDRVSTQQITDELARWAEPRGVRAVRWYCCHARALAAL